MSTNTSNNELTGHCPSGGGGGGPGTRYHTGTDNGEGDDTYYGADFFPRYTQAPGGTQNTAHTQNSFHTSTGRGGGNKVPAVAKKIIDDSPPITGSLTLDLINPYPTQEECDLAFKKAVTAASNLDPEDTPHPGYLFALLHCDQIILDTIYDSGFFIPNATFLRRLIAGFIQEQQALGTKGDNVLQQYLKRCFSALDDLKKNCVKKEGDDVESISGRLYGKIQALQPGESTFYFGGFTNKTGSGHSMIYVFTRESQNTFRFSYIDTSGTSSAPVAVLDLKKKQELCVSYAGLTSEELHRDFITAIVRARILPDPTIPTSLDAFSNYVLSAFPINKRVKSSGDGLDFITMQHSGTCSVKSLLGLFFLLTKECRNASNAPLPSETRLLLYKKLIFRIKVASLCRYAKHELEETLNTDTVKKEQERLLTMHACHSLARTAYKRFNIGHITIDEYREVCAICFSVKQKLLEANEKLKNASLAKKKILTINTSAPLHLDLTLKSHHSEPQPGGIDAPQVHVYTEIITEDTFESMAKLCINQVEALKDAPIPVSAVIGQIENFVICLPIPTPETFKTVSEEKRKTLILLLNQILSNYIGYFAPLKAPFTAHHINTILHLYALLYQLVSLSSAGESKDMLSYFAFNPADQKTLFNGPFDLHFSPESISRRDSICAFFKGACPSLKDDSKTVFSNPPLRITLSPPSLNLDYGDAFSSFCRNLAVRQAPDEIPDMTKSHLAERTNDLTTKNFPLCLFAGLLANDEQTWLSVQKGELAFILDIRRAANLVRDCLRPDCSLKNSHLPISLNRIRNLYSEYAIEVKEQTSVLQTRAAYGWGQPFSPAIKSYTYNNTYTKGNAIVTSAFYRTAELQSVGKGHRHTHGQHNTERLSLFSNKHSVLYPYGLGRVDAIGQLYIYRMTLLLAATAEDRSMSSLIHVFRRFFSLLEEPSARHFFFQQFFKSRFIDASSPFDRAISLEELRHELVLFIRQGIVSYQNINGNSKNQALVFFSQLITLAISHTEVRNEADIAFIEALKNEHQFFDDWLADEEDREVKSLIHLHRLYYLTSLPELSPDQQKQLLKSWLYLTNIIPHQQYADPHLRQLVETKCYNYFSQNTPLAPEMVEYLQENLTEFLEAMGVSLRQNGKWVVTQNPMIFSYQLNGNTLLRLNIYTGSIHKLDEGIVSFNLDTSFANDLAFTSLFGKSNFVFSIQGSFVHFCMNNIPIRIALNKNGKPDFKQIYAALGSDMGQHQWCLLLDKVQLLRTVFSSKNSLHLHWLLSDHFWWEFQGKAFVTDTQLCLRYQYENGRFFGIKQTDNQNLNLLENCSELKQFSQESYNTFNHFEDSNFIRIEERAGKQYMTFTRYQNSHGLLEFKYENGVWKWVEDPTYRIATSVPEGDLDRFSSYLLLCHESDPTKRLAIIPGDIDPPKVKQKPPVKLVSGTPFDVLDLTGHAELDYLPIYLENPHLGTRRFLPIPLTQAGELAPLSVEQTLLSARVMAISHNYKGAMRYLQSINYSLISENDLDLLNKIILTPENIEDSHPFAIAVSLQGHLLLLRYLQKIGQKGDCSKGIDTMMEYLSRLSLFPPDLRLNYFDEMWLLRTYSEKNGPVPIQKRLNLLSKKNPINNEVNYENSALSKPIKFSLSFSIFNCNTGGNRFPLRNIPMPPEERKPPNSENTSLATLHSRLEKKQDDHIFWDFYDVITDKRTTKAELERIVFALTTILTQTSYKQNFLGVLYLIAIAHSENKIPNPLLNFKKWCDSLQYKVWCKDWKERVYQNSTPDRQNRYRSSENVPDPRSDLLLQYWVLELARFYKINSRTSTDIKVRFKQDKGPLKNAPQSRIIDGLQLPSDHLSPKIPFSLDYAKLSSHQILTSITTGINQKDRLKKSALQADATDDDRLTLQNLNTELERLKALLAAEQETLKKKKILLEETTPTLPAEIRQLEEFIEAYTKTLTKQNEELPPHYTIEQMITLSTQIESGLPVLKKEQRKRAEDLVKLARTLRLDEKLGLDNLALVNADHTSLPRIQDLILLFAQRRKEHYLAKNPVLREDEIQRLVQLTGEYMMFSVEIAQLNSLSTHAKKIEHHMQSDGEASPVVEKLLIELQLLAKQGVKEEVYIEHPELLCFAFQMGHMYRSTPDQIGALKHLLRKKDNNYLPSVVQLCMGAGKSYAILPTLAACSDKLPVVVTPSFQFRTLQNTIGDTLRKVYNMELIAMDYRKEELTLTTLQNIFETLQEALEQPKIGRKSAIIVCPEFPLSLFLEYFYTLRTLPDDVSQLNNDSEFQRLFYLGKILNIFANNVDAIGDEVQLLFDIFKEVNFPFGSPKAMKSEYIDLARQMFLTIANDSIPVPANVFDKMSHELVEVEKQHLVNTLGDVNTELSLLQNTQKSYEDSKKERALLVTKKFLEKALDLAGNASVTTLTLGDCNRFNLQFLQKRGTDQTEILVRIDTFMELSKNRQNFLDPELFKLHISPKIAEILAQEYEPLGLKNVSEPHILKTLSRYVSNQMRGVVQRAILNETDAYNTVMKRADLMSDMQVVQLLENYASSSVESEKAHAALLAVLKYFLTEILPSTITKVGNAAYGPSKKTTANAGLYKPGEAVPYISAATPSHTKFGNDKEEAVYQLTVALQYGILPDQLIDIAKDAHNDAMLISSTRGTPYSETTPAKEFKATTGTLPKDVSSTNAKEICENLDIDSRLRLAAITMSQVIQTYPLRLCGTAQNLFDLFRSWRAVGGTIDPFVLPMPMQQEGNTLLDPTVNTDLVHSLIKNANEHSIGIFEEDATTSEKIDELFRSAPNKDRVALFLDAVGTFKDDHPDEFAKHFLKAMKTHQPNKRAIVYFTRRNGSSSADFAAIMKQGDTIPTIIPDTSEKTLEKYGLPKGSYTAFCDQRHTLGTDFKLPFDAEAILISGKGVGMDDESQAHARLREAHLSQRVLVRISRQSAQKIPIRIDKGKSLYDYFAPGSAPITRAVAKMLLFNFTMQTLHEDAAHSAKAIHRSFEKALDGTPINLLRKAQTDAFADLESYNPTTFSDTAINLKKLANAFKPAVFKENPDQPYLQHGSLKEAQDILATLENRAERIYENLVQHQKTLGIESTADASKLLNDVRKHNQKILKMAKSLIERFVTYVLQPIKGGSELSELGTELELAVQMEEEVEQDQEIEQDIERELQTYQGDDYIFASLRTQWTDEDMKNILHELENLQPKKTFAVRVSKTIQRYGEIFSNNFFISCEASNPFDTEVSQFDRRQPPKENLLYVHSQKGEIAVVLSAAEADQMNHFLEANRKQYADHCFLLKPSGLLQFGDITSYSDLRQKSQSLKKALLEVSVLSMQPSFPLEEYDFLLEWYKEKKDLKIRFIKLMALLCPEAKERILKCMLNQDYLQNRAIQDERLARAEAIASGNVGHSEGPGILFDGATQLIPDDISDEEARKLIDTLPEEMLSRIGRNHIHLLPPDQIHNMKPTSENIVKLTKAQLEQLPLNKIKPSTLRTIIKNLTETQIGYLRDSNLISLIPLTMRHKMHPDLLAHLPDDDSTATALGLLTEEQLSYIPLDLFAKYFAPNPEASANNQDLVTRIPNLKRPGLIQRLPPSALRHLSDGGLEHLSQNQLASLRDRVTLERLSESQIQTLNDEQIAFLRNPSALARLSDAQLCKLSSAKISSLATTPEGQERIRRFNAFQYVPQLPQPVLPFLSDAALHRLSNEQIISLSDPRILPRLSDAQLCKLSSGQINSLANTPVGQERIGRFNAFQYVPQLPQPVLPFLSDAALHHLSNEQIISLSDPRILPRLSDAQLCKLSSAQINSLANTPVGQKRIRRVVHPDVVPRLPREALAFINKTLFSAITADQLNHLSSLDLLARIVDSDQTILLKASDGALQKIFNPYNYDSNQSPMIAAIIRKITLPDLIKKLPILAFSFLQEHQLQHLSQEQVQKIEEPRVFIQLPDDKMNLATSQQLAKCLVPNCRDLHTRIFNMHNEHLVRRLPQCTFTYLNPQATQSLSDQQVQLITNAKIISRLSTAQIQFLSEEALHNLPPTRVPELNADRISLLPQNKLGNLSPAQVATLPLEQISRLTAQRTIQMVSNEKVNAVDDMSLHLLTAQQITHLSINKINNSKNKQLIRTLPPKIIQHVDERYLSYLDSNQIAHLHVTQIKHLSDDQIRYLPPALVEKITDPSIIRKLTSDQIQFVNLSCISHLTPSQFSHLSWEQVRSITDLDTIKRLKQRQTRFVSSKYIPYLTSSQLSYLSKEQVSSITDPGTIKRLPRELLRFLHPNVLNHLAPEQLQFLNREQIPNITEPKLLQRIPTYYIKYVNPDMVRHLRDEDLSYIFPSQVVKINNPDTIARLPDSQIRNLHQDALQHLPDHKLSHLSQVQVSAIRNPDTIARLPNEQIRFVHADAIEHLTDEQLKHLTPAQIRACNSKAVIQALSLEEIQLVSPCNMDHLTDAQVAHLKHLNFLNDKNVATMDPKFVPHLSDEDVKHLETPEQIKNVKFTQLLSLEPNQIQHLSCCQKIAFITNSIFAALLSLIILIPVEIVHWTAVALSSRAVESVHNFTIMHLVRIKRLSMALCT